MPARSLGFIRLAPAVLSTAIVAAAPQSSRVAGEPIRIQAAAVPLNPNDPSQSAVGAFTYAGGLVLTSTDTDRLHGLSDLAITGTDRITAVSDEGALVTARLVLDTSGRLTGVADGRITPLIGEDGRPLSNKEEADAEGLALFPNGDRLVSFERHHRILLYPAAGGPPRAVPKPDVAFPDSNGGMEALAPDPDAGRDAYIVGAEQTGQTWHCRVSKGCVQGPTMQRPAGTSLVAIRRLPGGRLAVLFRSFATLTGSHIVLRVLRGSSVEGELELAEPLTVDNVEGVATVQRRGDVIRFYLVSDDNASSRQRTLLLAFDWHPR